MAPKKQKTVIWMWINEHPRLEITSSKSFYDMFAKDARATVVWNGLIPSTDRMKVWGKSRTSSRAACARPRMESAARALQVWVGLRGGAWAIYDPPLLPLHYTCDEIHIAFNCPNLLRFRCVSFCCTRYKMSQWRDQVWLIAYLNPRAVCNVYRLQLYFLQFGYFHFL